MFQTVHYLLGFEVLIAVVLKSSLFWDIMPQNLESQLAFEGTNCLQVGSACYLLHAGFLLGLFFDTEDGGNMFLQNLS
jgi:hypothetical protein